MKKETIVKNVTKLHNQLLEDSHKLRDLVYTIEDPDLCEQIDEWCENFEGYLEEEGSIESFVESVESVFDALAEEEVE